MEEGRFPRRSRRKGGEENACRDRSVCRRVGFEVRVELVCTEVPETGILQVGSLVKREVSGLGAV